MAGFSIKLREIFLSNSARISYSVARFLRSASKVNPDGFSSHLLWSGKAESAGKLRVLCDVDVHVRSPDPALGSEVYERVSGYLVAVKGAHEEEMVEKFRKILKCSSYAENGLACTDVQLNTDGDGTLKNVGLCGADPVTTKLLIEIPHFYDLDINCTSRPSQVRVEKLEGEICVQAVGDCVLSQLKCPTVSVVSEQGTITGTGSLVGNIALSTIGNGGDITLDKVQGNHIKIHCEDGDVCMKSLYGGDTVVTSESGHVRVGDTHGNVRMSSCRGNVTVGSISAGLLTTNVKHGDLEAKITNGGNIDSCVPNGNAVIKLDDNIACDLDFTARSLNISPDCLVLNKTEQHDQQLVTMTGFVERKNEQQAIVNCPNGYVELLKESWFVFPSGTQL